jgi:hypothetical protein
MEVRCVQVVQRRGQRTRPFSDKGLMIIDYRKPVLSCVIHRCLMITVLMILSYQYAIAAQVRHLDVHHKGGLYSISVEAYLNAPVSDVYAELTDYDNFERVADAIIESDTVGNPEPGVYSN